MPLIKPNKNEEKAEFISRFINDEIAKKEFPDNEQRLAIANSIWEDKNKADSIDKSITFKMDSSSKYNITDEGYLQCEAYIAKPGIMRYDYGDEILDEYFPPSECFDKESMDSARLKPIIVEHAFDGYQYNMMNAENIKDYQIGYSGESLVKEDNKVKINVLITHKDSVDQILTQYKEGKNVELSMGYKCRLIRIGGTTSDNVRYDAIQVKRRYNHISIVDKGRAGADVRLKFDKRGDIIMGKKHYTKNAIKYDSFTSDALNITISDEDSASFDRVWNKFDEAIIAIGKQDNIIKKQETKYDELLAKFDQAEDTIKTQQEKMDELQNPNSETFQSILNVRKELEKNAAIFKIDCKNLDNKSIKLATIQAASKSFDYKKEYSDEYINARYDTVIDLVNITTAQKHNDDLKSIMMDSLKLTTPTINPRAEFIKKSQEMHKE